LVEIVVVDDASPIPFQYAEPMNPNGIPVRVLRAEENQGPGVARSLGVANARGEWVAFLDSDDQFSAKWPDAVIEILLSLSCPERARTRIFVGEAIGGKASHLLTRGLLSQQSRDAMRRFLTRVVTLFFNPFYTPTLVISRSACRFHPTLRYCEDYFTFIEAVFRAEEIHFLSVAACQLSRSPGQAGGLSSARRKMLLGEMLVRRHVVQSRSFPLYARLLMPFGIIYQFSREAARPVLIGLGRLARKFGSRFKH
jgi:glycosyltransferase involved in cell wall biosynthesis